MEQQRKQQEEAEIEETQSNGEGSVNADQEELEDEEPQENGEDEYEYDIHICILGPNNNKIEFLFKSLTLHF